MVIHSPPLHAYQQNVLQMRHSSAIDFPAHVHLETMAQCNAACNFCPYPSLERKGTVISAGMSDPQLLKHKRRNKIDIFVDLSGHTLHDRLPVFIRKLPLIQIVWLGYQRTDPSSIDHRIKHNHATLLT
jgi:hypothetical protein